VRTARTIVVGLLLTGLLVCPLAAGEGGKKVWTFEDDTAGMIATGFTNEVGEWKAISTPDGKVLAQTAKNPDSVFNVALVSDTNVKDVDISVKMKAIAGENDQGGGLVWRAKDAKNYYIARNNPLGAGSYNVYKVVDGKRSMLKGVPLERTAGWHTLRVTIVGDHIECYYDGKKYLDVDDTTFPEAGKIGLWSKSDAQSHFDDLTLITP
jgi:3-keto-disaccharide hydrolase